MPNQELVIGLNSLIFDRNFNNLKRKILAFHDRRFLSEEIFIEKIKKINNIYPVISNKKNSNDARYILGLEIVDIENYIIDKKMYQEYLSEFCAPDDLLRNAAFEIGIPLALGMGVKKIKMYGCSFDYGMKDECGPQYYNGLKFKSFEQTQESAKNWSDYSNKRFSQLLNWCSLRKIEIIKN